MAHKKGVAKTPLIIKKVAWGIMSIIILTIVISGWLLWPKATPPADDKKTATAPVDYPLCANSPRREVKIGEKVEITLFSNCWSGWISLPDKVRGRVRTFSSGDLEYNFWSGSKILVPDGAALYDVAKNIPESVFRLRGTGKAEVSVEKL